MRSPLVGSPDCELDWAEQMGREDYRERPARIFSFGRDRSEPSRAATRDEHIGLDATARALGIEIAHLQLAEDEPAREVGVLGTGGVAGRAAWATQRATAREHLQQAARGRAR